MQTFLSFLKEFRIPKKPELIGAITSFSKKNLIILGVSVFVALVSLIVILAKINAYFLVEVPKGGGSITEGIIGVPSLVNPVLALSDADKDLTTLVYSGLMRKESNGTFSPDLAESYTVSPDGITYTFTLRKDATFQDGTPVTADDVIFTIEKIKDPLIKSPRKLGWDGITVAKGNDNTVVFTLKQPYISFMDNTTIGILPSHLWGDLSPTEFALSALNIKAVGSGPYTVKTVDKNTDGVPQTYTLERFSKFALGMPHIKTLHIVSYSNEKDLVDALLSHSIDQAGGISPEDTSDVVKAGYTIHTATLPRIFGLFFNSTNNKIFADTAVVHAFDKALDREGIVNTVLNGYGSIIHSPIPQTILPNQETDTYKKASIDEANALLDQAHWTVGSDGIRQKGGTSTVTQTKKVGKKTVTEKVTVNNGPIVKLSFSITTGDTPELKEASFLIKEELEKLGAHVDVKVYGTGELNSRIRARDYDSLFFGQIVNHESDLFSFWHSSQKSDPGLNISLYSNSKVDTILQAAQKTSDEKARQASYGTLISQFNTDLPALLVYSPNYVYATSNTLNNLQLDTVTIPSDRFASVYTWYADTDYVWKIFTK
jgi:peptide/nickel transport system substrate-binding protein